MIAFLLALAVQDSAHLALPGLAERALAQHPAVAAARHARSRAGADQREARSALLPRLSLEASVTQYQEPWLVYPLHGFPTALPPGGAAPAFDRTLMMAGAFVGWTLFDFGQRTSRLAAARALADAADASSAAAEAAIVARTAVAYLRTLSAREIVAAQNQRLRAIEAEAERSRRLLAEGTAPRLLVLRADAALARARAEHSQAAAQLELAEQNLARLTGLQAEALRSATLAPVSPADTAASARLPRVRQQLIARAAESSPDVSAARRRADAARAASAAARAGRLPELRLQTGVIDRGAIGHDFRAEWQAALTLSFSPYTGGQRSALVARAEADAAIADEQRRAAELDVSEAVDRAIAALVEARARAEALTGALEHSASVAAVERTALEVGSGTQPDYLEALADVLRDRSALVEARHAELAALIELARITGELSTEWLRTWISESSPSPS